MPEQIYNALKDSLNLVVVCSTKLADDEKAKWVNKEISVFIEIGTKEGVDIVMHIFPFIVDGISNAGARMKYFNTMFFVTIALEKVFPISSLRGVVSVKLEYYL